MAKGDGHYHQIGKGCLHPYNWPVGPTSPIPIRFTPAIKWLGPIGWRLPPKRSARGGISVKSPPTQHPEPINTVPPTTIIIGPTCQTSLHNRLRSTPSTRLPLIGHWRAWRAKYAPSDSARGAHARGAGVCATGRAVDTWIARAIRGPRSDPIMLGGPPSRGPYRCPVTSQPRSSSQSFPSPPIQQAPNPG